MSEKIIKKIEIEIAGVSVKVTPKEAKALFEALDESLNLPTKEAVKEVVRKKWFPYYLDYQPTWIYTINMVPATNYTLTYTTNTVMASVKI